MSDEVVLRRPKDQKVFKLGCGLALDGENGDTKKVKWSDSTELREKMKEYRRSQFSMTFDYQHIAIDEEREREGVKKWREIKDQLENDEDDETTTPTNTELPDSSTDNIEDDDSPAEYEPPDSDGDDPYCDDALETKLRVIKAKASRFTVLPAYTAALYAYDRWFESQPPSSVGDDQLGKMTSQRNLYDQVVTEFGQWDDSTDANVIDKSYQVIVKAVLDAKKMGDAPHEVTEALNSVMNDEYNVKIHKDTYSKMVDEMVTDLSAQIQDTSL